MGINYKSTKMSYCRTDVLHSTLYPTIALWKITTIYCEKFALEGSGQASIKRFWTVSIFNGDI